MSVGPREELERVLAELARRLAAGGRPDRYDARAVLIPLGELVLAEGEGAEPALERVRSVTAPAAEAWAQAVAAELALACAEHVHSVDARFLHLPNYDFAYTIRARERLEARLVGAAALGLEATEAQLDQVALADEVLAPWLVRRKGPDPG